MSVLSFPFLNLENFEKMPPSFGFIVLCFQNSTMLLLSIFPSFLQHVDVSQPVRDPKTTGFSVENQHSMIFFGHLS